MAPQVVGLIGIAALLLLIMINIPVGFVLTLVGLLGFGYLININAALNMVAKDFYTVFTSYGLTVIPLFILMGQVAYHSGISRRLFDSTYMFIGHRPGGLAIATIIACAGLAAICG